MRFGFKYDGGGLGKGATGTLFVDGKQVAQDRISRTIPIRFSLDETFDIGEDTGTPVVEDYVDKMPFAFSGTLKKFVVVLEPQKLSPEERQRLQREEAQASMIVQWELRTSIRSGQALLRYGSNSNSARLRNRQSSHERSPEMNASMPVTLRPDKTNR